MTAQLALANLPLAPFLSEAIVPYENEEVMRPIVDTLHAAAFSPVAHLTVGDFRNCLLGDAGDTATHTALAPGLTPEMVVR